MIDGIAKMGEVVYSEPKLTILRALGLGSCIGMCVFDPIKKFGALAHIVMPDSGNKKVADPGKFADTAVPYVIEQMVERGAMRSRLSVAIAGGAQLFSFHGAGERLDVGRRNTEAVKYLIAKSRLTLVEEDVGGVSGRTLIFDTSTGIVTVRSSVSGEKQLANLGYTRPLKLAA